MSKKECLQMAVALITIIGAIVGVNAYFAKASDLELVEMRLEQKIITDASMQTEARMWKVLDRNDNAKSCTDIRDDKDKEECRSLEQKVRELDKRNKVLMEKVPTIMK